MYWTNAALKIRAKEQLRGRWGKYLSVVFLYTVITEILGYVYALFERAAPVDLLSWLQLQLLRPSIQALLDVGAATPGVDMGQLATLQALLDYTPTVGQLIGGAVELIASLLLTFFVYNILEVGLNRWFMEARGGTPDTATLFSGFTNREQWKNTACVLFFTTLYTSLWTLLFLIPGVIYALQVALVPYLLAENPYMSKKRAIELSKALTRGEKWHIFLLLLSFIGWFLLAGLANILVTMLVPVLAELVFAVAGMMISAYMWATMAELYATMREKAFQLGYSDASELAGFAA